MKTNNTACQDLEDAAFRLEQANFVSSAFNRRDSNYAGARSATDAHQQKNKESSQMSISISVHNQSMGVIDLRQSTAKKQEDQEAPHLVMLSQQSPVASDQQVAKEIDDITLSISAEQFYASRQNSAQITAEAKQLQVVSRKNSSNQSPSKNEIVAQFQSSQKSDGYVNSNNDKSGPLDKERNMNYVSADIISNNVISEGNELRQRSIQTAVRFHNPLKVKKKRVKSTRTGGIRGGVLIQDKYSKKSPNRKTEMSYKQLQRGEESSAKRMGASTNAGEHSSALYKSYRPTSMIRIGANSVQRLKPRMPQTQTQDGDNISSTYNSVRPLTAQRTNLLSNQTGQLSQQYTSISQVGQRKVRPQSQFSYNSKGVNMQKFSSGKLNQQGVGKTGNFPLPVKLYQDEPTQTAREQFLRNNDGFKLVSQFESEQAAVTYAQELQKYYNNLNMDVKVQIEANLTELDDTDDKSYLREAFMAEHRKLEKEEHQAQNIDKLEREKNQRLNIKSAFSNHFKFVDPIQVREIKGITKRTADLTAPKFQKKVSTNSSIKPNIEYDKLSRKQIQEVMTAQEQIFGVIKDTTQLPSLSYKNQDAAQRSEMRPSFQFDLGVRQTQIKHRANLQAQILHKLGVLPAQLQGEVPHASQVMSNDNKIPKSRAKFYQRERKLQKLFDAQVNQWQKDIPSIETNRGVEQQSDFEVDVRLYKERGDNYCIIGNKVQFRASEQNENGRNYTNKQALQTKGNFDPIRIRLRIMPISRCPLAQGKTSEFYFLEAAKKSLSGDLTSAIEQLKRGLMLNPNHFICRFNHGVLMFKFGLIKEATKDFEQLITHPHGMKDPWVYYNLATCLIQLGQPSRPLYEQEKEFYKKRRLSAQRKSIVVQQMINNVSTGIVGETMNKLERKHTKTGSETNFFGAINSIMETTLTAAGKQEFYTNCKGTENYQRAIEMCNQSIQLGSADKEIVLDALNLKAICMFRLGQLIESVKVLRQARTLKAKILFDIEERRRLRMKKDEDDDQIGFFQRRDIKLMKKKRSNSFHFERHLKMRFFKQRQLKRDQSWLNADTNDARLAALQKNQEETSSSSEEGAKKISDQNIWKGQSAQIKQITEKSFREESESQSESADSNASRRVIKEVAANIEKKLETLDQSSNEEKSQSQSDQVNSLLVLPGLNGVNPSKKSQFQPKDQMSVRKSNSSFDDDQIDSIQKQKNSEKKLRFDITETTKQKTLKRVNAGFEKTILHAVEERCDKIAQVLSKKRRTNGFDNLHRISDLMTKLVQVNGKMVAERKKLRMSKEQYALYRQTYMDWRKRSDLVVDAGFSITEAYDSPDVRQFHTDHKLRLKNMYLKQFTEFEEDYKDCNNSEKEELRRRKAIIKWIHEDDLVSVMLQEVAEKLMKMSEVGVDPIEAELNFTFVQQLLKFAQVKVDEVCGTHIETLLDIIKDQSQMDDIIIELREKVKEMCHQFESELNRGNEDLNAQCPKLDEMKILRGDRHIDVEDENQGHEDKVITRLRDALTSEQMAPDEVINALTTDKFEKEKLKLQLQYLNGQSDSGAEENEKIFIKRKQIAPKRKNREQVGQGLRYTERHIEQIINQYSVPEKNRNYKVLDIMMRHLRYVKRHDADVRLQIYRFSQFVEFPAQHEIFKKGDEPDYMYIILKGRVSVESNLSQYEDIPVILNTLKDGDAFGELAVIDSNKILEDTTRTGDQRYQKLYAAAAKKKLPITNKRMATCKTIEKSRMIRIPVKEAKRIVQPTLKKESEYSTGSLPQAPSLQQSSIESFTNSVEQIPTDPKDYFVDDLNKRLFFLQSFSFFRDLKAKMLVPVALNMTVVQFKYGEFLTREGDVPPGMFLIKSGQCIVGLSRLSTRPVNQGDIPGQRMPIKDKSKLFNHFDPANSLLNNVEIQDRVFQNGRIFVNKNGEQIKDKIEYHDILQFSKLFPKKQFGGRTLLPFEMYLQLKRIYSPESLKRTENEPVRDMKSEEKYQMKSFLDVVADSAIVECFLLTKQGIQYLSDQYLKDIYEEIVMMKEPDRPYLEEKIIKKRDMMLASQAENLATVKKIMWENKIEKYGVMAVKNK